MYRDAAITFLQTAQWLNGSVARELEPLDLTAQQLKVLSIVAQSENQQAKVNEIKAQMFDPMSNVSRLLNKLMEKQLIVKVRNTEDQRLVHIQITPLGLESMCLGKEKMDAGLLPMAKLEEGEMEVLVKLLKKMRE